MQILRRSPKISIQSVKDLLQSGLSAWLVGLAGVTIAVVVCVLWLDRPIALLAYEWFGRHRAVQRLVETPGFFGPLVVLAFSVLLVRWMLTRRFGTIDVVANLCIITLAVNTMQFANLDERSDAGDQTLQASWDRRSRLALPPPAGRGAVGVAYRHLAKQILLYEKISLYALAANL